MTPIQSPAVADAQKTTSYENVATLGTRALGVEPVDRDWASADPELWGYVEASSCSECGRTAAFFADDESWRCETPSCPRCRDEMSDPYEYAEGPIMNFAFPFPGALNVADAEKLADLPVCVVNWFDTETSELALTGAGMDMSWELATAYMRLGQLPPVSVCDLPLLVDDELNEERRWVLAGCQRAVGEHRALGNSHAEVLLDRLGRMDVSTTIGY